MNDSLATIARPAIPTEVQQFAMASGLNTYLDALIDLARQAFPASSIYVSLGQDAEDESHRYIAFDVDAASHTCEELLAGQRTWTVGVTQICPSRQAVYFVLDWR